jgi:hypothetical protein
MSYGASLTDANEPAGKARACPYPPGGHLRVTRHSEVAVRGRRACSQQPLSCSPFTVVRLLELRDSVKGGGLGFAFRQSRRKVSFA